MSNFQLAKEFFLNGCIFFEQENFSEAECKFIQSHELMPDRVSTLINLSATQLKLQKYSEAKAAAEKALLIEGDNSEAYLNLGLIEKELNRFESAINFFDKAINLKPDYAEAWSNKGNVLNELKRYDEAIAHYDQALSLKPDYAEAWSNKGNVLNELKRYDEVIAHYDQALSLKPDYAEAWSNKGNVLNELKRYNEAIVHYDKALSLKPDIDWVRGDLVHTKMKICSWSSLADSLEFISKKVGANEKVSQPFALLALSDDPLAHKKSSELYIQSEHPQNLTLGPIPKYARNEKIRIGYFSGDFHNHATGYLMAELFELHDKSQFEIVGFSFGPKIRDEMRQRLENSFDDFIEVGNKSDIEIAQLSRRLNIDIAIDLKGFTQDSRTRIFSYRPAPIQVNYLGYPSTMGADYIDYIIADQTLIPMLSEHSYSEKVVLLPHSYQSNDRKRVIAKRQFIRKELGFPDQGFIFCCFNNNYKIMPATFDGWMRILQAVEGSVLWLLQDNFWVVENLKKEAQNRGVDAERLVFANRLPPAEHLARHNQADLFLDTFPYNAHTTASDALWAGLPVLTMMGQSFASRVAASLLNAIDLPELITNTQEQYEALAIELARNPQKLTDIKLKLANNRLTTPLFDTPLFTKNLEAAYIKMYERYQADLQPEHISIG
ncbi:glycosyltransferase family 41 protein [Polynucleobacter sp. MWH-Svant-W18]|uniref:O-linked N-acetylglucosamine transferase, SPINDLY family protein n=1 Tax=Polynucleobacter sp. MWH-Svant-W18 TaxID=1855909 RepID=UPI001BFE1108|nr:glycosyltransferase family 41 protein [Polynucleobacter sp. MWH-Svant-W18]QWD77731.1 tetratricopeptide repeat protein [Polynucleobacter sp. MWH-Svant-W18]